jgi:hypothetical protein
MTVISSRTDPVAPCWSVTATENVLAADTRVDDVVAKVTDRRTDWYCAAVAAPLRLRTPVVGPLATLDDCGAVAGHGLATTVTVPGTARRRRGRK